MQAGMSYAVRQMWSTFKPDAFADDLSSTSKLPLKWWVFLLLSLSLFFLPLSSSLKSISVATVLGLILFNKAYWPHLKDVFAQSWSRAMLVLILYALFACLWSPATLGEKGLIIEKYSKLLYLPLLTVGFAEKRCRWLGLHAFLLAMAITCLISVAKGFHWVQFGYAPAPNDPGSIFRNHVMTSFMMNIATLIAAFFFMHHRGRARWGYGCLVVLMSYQILFVNTSRSGYVIYTLLLFLFIVQSLSWRKAVVGIVAALSFIITSAYVSPVMHQKVMDARNDWRHHASNPNTPIGFRLQFHDFAAKLYHRHPWVGQGTGSFTYFFRIDSPVQQWQRRLLEPHSQYWLVMAEWGRVGFLLLIFFFASLFYAIHRLPTLRTIGIGLWLALVVGNVSDSLLFYSGTGYLFILLMALCLSESLPSVRTVKS